LTHPSASRTALRTSSLYRMRLYRIRIYRISLLLLL